MAIRFNRRRLNKRSGSDIEEKTESELGLWSG